MENLYYILIVGGLFFIGLIILMVRFTKNRGMSFVIGCLLYMLVIYAIGYYGKPYLSIEFEPFLVKYGAPSYSLALVIGALIVFTSKDKKSVKKSYNFTPIELSVQNGRNIKFMDPFNNFLVYAGANTGKTKSIGKPLLKGFVENKFAGMIYDLKEFDYTKAAYHFIKETGYDGSFYYVNFTDMSRTYRFNPLSVAAIPSSDDLPQLGEDLIRAYLPEGQKLNDWGLGGLGLLQGLMIRFRKDYPQYCTWPHISNFALHNSNKHLISFLEKDAQAKSLAGAFLDSKDSPKQLSGYKSSLTNYIGKLAYNKNICYVLSGNDFDFNLLDPEDPKLFAISNNYALRNILGPIMGMLVKISSRRFTMSNKIPFVYFMDEATTFKIDNFEEMPSELREYLCAFVFITQSQSKISALYGEKALSSMESNFANVFFGRTGDTVAQKRYVQQFDKIDEVKKTYSRSSGTHSSSSGHSQRVDKVAKYETSFFKHLPAGEFVGYGSNSNYNEFHLKLNMMQFPEELELPIVRSVSESDIEANYIEIINTIKNLY